MSENQGVLRGGQPDSGDFRAEDGSVRLLSVPNSPKTGDAAFRGR